MEEMDPATFTPDDSPLTIDDIMTSPLYQDLLTPTLSEGEATSRDVVYDDHHVNLVGDS